MAFYNVRFALFLDFHKRRLKINNFKAFPNMQSGEKIKNVQYLLMHSTYNALVSIKKKICFAFRFLCTVLTKKNVTGILTNFLWWSNIIYLIYPKNRFQKVFRFSCSSWYLLSSEMFVSIYRVVNSCACLVVCTVLLLLKALEMTSLYSILLQWLFSPKRVDQSSAYKSPRRWNLNRG